MTPEVGIISNDGYAAGGALDPTAVQERADERKQIELALDGDAMAYRRIVERHSNGLFALTLRMTGDRAEAEDLVQEAFARAFCKLGEFDSKYRFSTWLYRIALNLCRDHLKSPRRREAPGRAEDVDTLRSRSVPPRAEADLEAQQRAQRLRRGLGRLRPAYREIIVLKDLQELSYEEIHRITGASITALKVRVIRARAKLRKELEAEL